MNHCFSIDFDLYATSVGWLCTRNFPLYPSPSLRVQRPATVHPEACPSLTLPPSITLPPATLLYRTVQSLPAGLQQKQHCTPLPTLKAHSPLHRTFQPRSYTSLVFSPLLSSTRHTQIIRHGSRVFELSPGSVARHFSAISLHCHVCFISSPFIHLPSLHKPVGSLPWATIDSCCCILYVVYVQCYCLCIVLCILLCVFVACACTCTVILCLECSVACENNHYIPQH